MRAQRGVALMMSLALLVLISVAALDWSATARPRRLEVAAIIDRAELDAVATGGIEAARAQLSQLLRVGPMRSVRDPTRVLDAWSAADGTAFHSDAAGELQYRVEMHDAGARLNLNAASEDQFRKLLLAFRLDARRADRLAQALADWRDGDRLRRTNGAERDDYLRADRAVLPDDGPFESVSVLRFVMGMTDSLYVLLRSHVTVLGSGRINLNAAERPVLLTLPGMTEETVALLLRYRGQGRRVTDLNRFADELSPSGRSLLRSALPMLQAAAVLDTREIHVASDAWRRGGYVRVRIDGIVSRDDEGRVTWRRVGP